MLSDGIFLGILFFAICVDFRKCHRLGLWLLYALFSFGSSEVIVRAIQGLRVKMSLTVLQDEQGMRLVYMIFVIMSLIVLWMTTIAVGKYLVQKLHKRILLLFILLPIWQYMLTCSYFLICDQLNHKIMITAVLILGFSGIIDILVFYFINNMLEKERLEVELRNLYAKREVELNYNKLNEDCEKEIEQLRSKMLLQLKEVYGQLQKRADYGEVKALLDEAYNDIQSTKKRKYCDNAIVNSILTVKEKMAGDNQIEFQATAFLEENIGMEQIDLCSLFCNLIDNAIEACEKIEDESVKRFVRIKSDCKAGFLRLKVENAIDRRPHRIGNTFVSEKKISKLEKHGLGLKLVQGITEKYQGSCDIEVDKNKFSVFVIINLNN